jgi:hypothetical protein
MPDTSLSDCRGAYRYSDVVHSATPELVSTVHQLQSQIQPDDGFNLQFTSVSKIFRKCFVASDCSTLHVPSSYHICFCVVATFLCSLGQLTTHRV